MTTDPTSSPLTETEWRALVEKFGAWAATLTTREQAGLVALLAPAGTAHEADVSGYTTDLLLTTLPNLLPIHHDAKKAAIQNFRA